MPLIKLDDPEIQSSAGMSSQSNEPPTINDNRLPKLPVNLRHHILPIATTFTILFLCSSAIPVMLYFCLKYPARATPPVYLGVSTVSFGVSSLYSYFVRLYRLTMSKDNATYRPLHSKSKWALDLFQWDFTVSFCAETAMIVVSVALPPTTGHPYTDGALPGLTSFALPFFVANLCVQLLLTEIMVALGLRNPITISSVARGEVARPALYTIVEDVVAVDGKQGIGFPRAWDARYRASPQGTMRRLLARLEWTWSLSGICLSAAVAGIIWSPSVSHDTAWVVGWTVPWGWAGVMTLFTFWYVTKGLMEEKAIAMGS